MAFRLCLHLGAFIFLTHLTAFWVKRQGRMTPCLLCVCRHHHLLAATRRQTDDSLIVNRCRLWTSGRRPDTHRYRKVLEPYWKGRGKAQSVKHLAHKPGDLSFIRKSGIMGLKSVRPEQKKWGQEGHWDWLSCQHNHWSYSMLVKMLAVSKTEQW